MNDITKIEEEQAEVYRPSAAIDPKRLEYLWTLAERMASSTLVPETLRMKGSKNNKTDLTRDEIVANVFAVVEQADRWNQSPFALLSCAAIVHGKLGFEGKVIAAVLEANYGIRLRPYYKGQPMTETYHVYLCDEDLPDDVIAALEPGYRHPRYRIMDGSVKEWKTSGDGSPWRPATYAKMLIYRGEREWARVYKAAAIMGVLADDELLALEQEHRAQIARDVTPSLASRFGGNRRDGFNADNIKQLGADKSVPMDLIDTNTGEIIETTSSSSAASRSAADEGSGAGNDKAVDAAPTNQRSSTANTRGDRVEAMEFVNNHAPTASTRQNSSQATSSQPADDKAAETAPTPTVSAAADHRMTADQLKRAASFLARQDTPEKVDKAADTIRKGSETTPEPNDADLKLLSTLKGKVLACISDGNRPTDEIDAFNAAVDDIFGLNDFPGDQ